MFDEFSRNDYDDNLESVRHNTHNWHLRPTTRKSRDRGKEIFTPRSLITKKKGAKEGNDQMNKREIRDSVHWKFRYNLHLLSHKEKKVIYIISPRRLFAPF